MADFSAPSFSLGLDFDIADLPTDVEEEEENDRETSGEPPLQTDGSNLDKDFVDFIAGEDDAPPPALKRLRRGPPACPMLSSTPPMKGIFGNDNGSVENACDDIEDFSSPEKNLSREARGCHTLPFPTICGSSKLSLSYQGALRTRPGSNLKGSGAPPVSCSSTLTTLNASGDKKVFGNLTISPVRKINLLDSDSDDSSLRSPKLKSCKDSKSVDAKKNKLLERKTPVGGLWKEFSSNQKTKIPTPALDEFCEEYFRKKNDTKLCEQNEFSAVGSSSSHFAPGSFINQFDILYQNKHKNENMELEGNQLNCQPPVYQYLYHNDIRIQNLVRERLPYFVPLAAVHHNDLEHAEAANLNYKSQFAPRDTQSQARGAYTVAEGNSIRKRKKTKAKTTSTATGNWVNTRSKSPIPKDAGKRRVRADGHMSGHWFTGQDGRKVYVTKDGQELSGQLAYRHYKKDMGGFGKSKKKSHSKKNAAKKGRR